MSNDFFSNLDGWQQFKEKISSLNTKQKGDAFELLVKHYLQIDPLYKTKLKSVWLLGEVSLSLKRKLKLPSQDIGIDIIAETHEGEYWAIQCKYRDNEDSSMTWDELSTFTGLSFGICNNISFALVCTSTNRVTDVLSDQNNIGFCTGEVWRNLDSDFFNQLKSLQEHKPITIKPFYPRPHQTRAIKNAKQHFIKENNTKGKMIMPCGTGKSMTAYWIAEELKAKTIIVAVPSLALIRQSLKAWLRECVANDKNIKWICIASDESVGQIKRDDIAVLKQDLGIPTYTDSEKIANWLQTSNDSIIVVFTTYQSGKTISEATRKANIIFDLGVIDEAHKTVGSKNKLFSHLLFDDNIRIKKRLFMTATERRYKGLSDDIISMDDFDVYGETFELLTFKEALSSEPPILSDYKIVTIAVDKEEIKELIKNNYFVIPDNKNWDEVFEAKTLAANIALQKAFEEYSINHAISFHNSITKAQKFQKTQSKYSELYESKTNLSTYHVSGKLPTSVRDKTIKEFESTPPSLITNARCLTEGVDVPNIDCVLFADSKKSTIDIVQAIGRALRIYEGKEYAYIIIPILTDSSNLDGELIDEESFRELLTTLRALASNDERIIEFFSAISKNKKSNGFINIEINEKLSTKIDSKKFVESIELMIWGKVARLSWMPFSEARDYARNLELKSQREWQKYVIGKFQELPSRPPDVPSNPQSAYKNQGWKNWGDWLGTGRIATTQIVYRNFDDARKFVRSLKLKSSTEWRKYTKGELTRKPLYPKDIPSLPHKTYKDKGWKNWGDWLGTGRIATNLIGYRKFEDARAFVRKLKLKNTTEWNKYVKGEFENKPSLPKNIPSNPRNTYKDKGWKGYGDWLGTGRIAPSLMRYRKFEDARAFVRRLKLKSNTEWKKYVKGELHEKPTLPSDIPKAPWTVYKDSGWKTYGDWLGTGRIASNLIEYRNFEDARAFVRRLKLKNTTEWKKFPEQLLPKDIPKNPSKTYKHKGWKGYGDWLGTGKIATNLIEYKTFDNARKFVRNLQLTGQRDWRKYVKGEYKDKPPLPPDIPSNPHSSYKTKGWNGYGDWLGTGSVSPRLKKYKSYIEARDFVRKLKLKSGTEWRNFPKDLLPKDIPKTPGRIYKNKGWKGIKDWLGAK